MLQHIEARSLVTPLLEIPVDIQTTNGVRLFMKREDLLPYGGGNKVRRLLHWRESHPTCRELTVLSDYGSHTFYTLSRMASAFDALIFYERRCATTPYRDAMHQAYSYAPGISIVQGSLGELWLRSQADRRPRLGIGGNMPSAAVAYREPMRDCVQQLHHQGVVGVPIVHIFPIASGTMADGFLQELAVCAPATGHSLIGVLTGHPLARPWLRLRYARQPLMRLLPSDPQNVGQVAGQRAVGGAHLDPNHGLYAWHALLRLLPKLRKDSVAVFWVTSPDCYSI